MSVLTVLACPIRAALLSEHLETQRDAELLQAGILHVDCSMVHAWRNQGGCMVMPRPFILLNKGPSVSLKIHAGRVPMAINIRFGNLILWY